MNILDEVIEILRTGYVCDHCLGREFAQILSGYSNAERGKMLRALAAMYADSIQSLDDMDPSNFSEFKFRTDKLNQQKAEKKTCWICNGFFDRIDEFVKKILKKIKKCEFNSFLVGSKLSSDLIENEEKLWDKIGIEHCEPIKAEINREVGKRIEKILEIKADLRKPDLVILLDLKNDDIEIKINPLFIYGEYQKLVRDIPQTKWPSGKYKTSVEEIIAKPVMKLTKGTGHKLHGLGREDIDARCLGWRPFVLEILEPRKRFIDLKSIESSINKGTKVKVRNLRFSNIDEVRKIKEIRSDKTYRVEIICEREITKNDIRKILSLKGRIITQRTPNRVLHRRSDLVRKRKLKDIKIKMINKKKLIATLTTEAGFYVKEFIHGDNGRTKPSISSILNTNCEPKNLDVVKIHYKNKR